MRTPLYAKVKEFKRKYPWTISWRLWQHCKIVDMHLNPGEVVKFAFAAQKNDNPFDIISTYVIALTNKRILLGQKRLLFGYFYTAITPDMFNDLNLKMGLIWGNVNIDTVKEVVILSHIQREALTEIETEITEYMMREKKKYPKLGDK
ncbi:MAG: PH domain-containing protein [Ignavibacteriales bacterium]